MITEKSILKSEAVFSDDKQHRYLLTKEWDKAKQKATIISLAPGGDYNICCDLTTMLISNNLFRLQFGSFNLVNLISKIGIDCKKVKELADSYNEETDQQIVSSVQKTDITILAWGKIVTTNKVFLDRENQIMELLKPYTEKLFVIEDITGRTLLHPLTPAIRNNWMLQKITLKNS